MPTPLRVLQLSDVHFGAPLSGGRLALPAALASQRAQERRQAFQRAIDLVVERELDGVLLPGDLFDDESIDADTLRFVQHQLGRVAPRPVFVAPGNHDPYGGTSPYNPAGGREARGLQWPDNVVLFAHGDFRSVPWPGRDDVQVTGCGVAANVPSGERRLAARVQRPAAPLELLLFHGSRDDGSWLQAHKSTYPFSRGELLAQGFHWTALGHYHAHQVLADDAGAARAAYAGSLLAGGLDEAGPKGACVVEVGADGCEVEFVALDPRQVHRVEVDLTGAGFREEAEGRVRGALDAAGVRDSDLVLLELRGRRAPALDLGFLDGVAAGYFHLRCRLRDLVPDVDLDHYPPAERARTTEERFVAALRERLDDDPDGEARRALLYGLDALQRGRLDVRYEE